MVIRMVNRRRAALRPVVIDAEILDLPRLSPAALGIYVVIAAARGGIRRQELLDRYGENVGALDARLTELKRHALIKDAGR
ncbi:hypothetical protein MKK75_05670 [Methylobacterium sp. J-030]|uniref:hypothetical protein n=1 Tax=Methylobacterium sp. J-030 TaxID=2836627 RepID=UPI001FB8688F|nr:hypothetical protein [Methylobacterium sp. J-030]MCJ2068300.1 hypothetical protein [Methylobacterium sp. J-030]